MTAHASVIVPFYNSADTLRVCIESLLAQDFADGFEIICIDNNSTDGGADTVPRDPRVRILTEPRQGAYAARNTGVRAADGSVLLFTDPDCIASTNWIAAHVAKLRAGARVSLGRVQHGGRGKILALLSEYDHARQEIVFGERIALHYFGYTNNLATTKETWLAMGPFEERERGADTIFVQHVAAQFGADAVRYARDARVDHLEVNTVGEYLHKMFLYGRSSKLFRGFAEPAPPAWHVRRRAVNNALAALRGGSLDRAKLLGALGAGVAAWQLGYRFGFGALRKDAVQGTRPR